MQKSSELPQGKHPILLQSFTRGRPTHFGTYRNDATHGAGIFTYIVAINMIIWGFYVGKSSSTMEHLGIFPEQLKASVVVLSECFRRFVSAALSVSVSR